MFEHQFIFNPGEWLGHGKIYFSTSSEIIPFYTKWDVGILKNDVINCIQRVEKQGVDEAIVSILQFSKISESTFEVMLENEISGLIRGSGTVNAKTIAWEFKERAQYEDTEGFLGNEIYMLETDGGYSLHAEYFTDPQYRTFIKGQLWKKS